MIRCGHCINHCPTTSRTVKVTIVVHRLATQLQASACNIEHRGLLREHPAICNLEGPGWPRQPTETVSQGALTADAYSPSHLRNLETHLVDILNEQWAQPFRIVTMRAY